jgi:hypothetical protein
VSILHTSTYSQTSPNRFPRHIIFEHISVRDTEPKLLFRNWFEKREVKEIVAKEVASDPNAPNPVVEYPDRRDEESEPDVDPDYQDEPEAGDDDDGDDGDDDEAGEDDEEVDDEGDEDDVGEDEEQEEDENEGGDEDEVEMGEEMDINENVEGETGAGMEDETEGTGPSSASDESAPDMLDNADGTVEPNQADIDQEISDSPGDNNQVDSTVGSTAVIVSGANEEEQDEAAEGMHDGENGNNAEGGGEGDGDEATTNADVTVAAAAVQTTPPPPPPSVVRPHPKWRHIPKFVRITHSPPPVSLLCLCKQLSEEAKHWFYKVAVLKIDATASFSHMSFFELALTQLAESAFSPMENIRKAEVRFVWDTTWIRAESTGYAANVFGYFLQTRADYVLKILQQAPDLEQVVIHWHDSANDEEAQLLMQDILEKFVSYLVATIDTQAHIIASDAKPHPKSIAGKRRLEFQGIVDNPPECF